MPPRRWSSGQASRIADVSQISADPSRSRDADDQPTLQRMVQVILEAEAPVRDDLLAQRVARAHGWLRTVSRIGEPLEPHMLAYERASESVGDFVRLNGNVAPVIPHRAVTDETFRRSVTEILVPELAGLFLPAPSFARQ